MPIEFEILGVTITYLVTAKWNDWYTPVVARRLSEISPGKFSPAQPVATFLILHTSTCTAGGGNIRRQRRKGQPSGSKIPLGGREHPAGSVGDTPVRCVPHGAMFLSPRSQNTLKSLWSCSSRRGRSREPQAPSTRADVSRPTATNTPPFAWENTGLHRWRFSQPAW